jgi:hypothetical protein
MEVTSSSEMSVDSQGTAEHRTLKTNVYGHNRVFQGAGIAQSVQRLATGWMTEWSEFESRLG